MPIVGFNFDKTTAEKKANVKKGMQASHSILIKSVLPEKINLGKEQTSSGLKFTFEYNVKYEPKIGEVNVTGHILFLEEEKRIKEILTNWTKNKKIESELTTQIINTAIVKSTIKALSLSQDLNLPPHLPIPVVSPHIDKAREYIG
ncbi:MAG: hypothetical protein CMH62_02845 [Nanoarchaeota archaeon]|nr:hypothetical protein [Nanoarchaeota archaeon]|tara:strand:- start:391 stop:828 length:438 start_codon:yes stop_codon:yes gene_type:complete